MFKLTYKTEFHASHRLPNYPGKCNRLHGHNWLAEVEATSETLNEHGMVADFDTIKGVMPDHRDLNEWLYVLGIELPPTTEVVAKVIFDELVKAGVPATAVTLHETARGSVRYEPAYTSRAKSHKESELDSPEFRDRLHNVLQEYTE